MISVDFSLRSHDQPSRLELVVRPIFFIPSYIMFNLIFLVLAVLAAANGLLSLIMAQRSKHVSRSIAIAGGAHLARSLAYFWCATDHRPALVPLEENPGSDFRWILKERANRLEVLVRVLLVPLYSCLLALVLACGTVIGLAQAVFILMFGSRERKVVALTEESAELCSQILCYSFFVTDERPLLSAG